MDTIFFGGVIFTIASTFLFIGQVTFQFVQKYR